MCMNIQLGVQPIFGWCQQEKFSVCWLFCLWQLRKGQINPARHRERKISQKPLPFNNVEMRDFSVGRGRHWPLPNVGTLPVAAINLRHWAIHDTDVPPKSSVHYRNCPLSASRCPIKYITTPCIILPFVCPMHTMHVLCLQSMCN